MRRINIILSLVFLPLSLVAQTQFFKVVGTGNTQEGTELITSQNSGYILLMNGSYNPPINSRVNFGIVHTDLAGDPVYVAENMVDSSCFAKKVVELPNKDLLVLGTSYQGYSGNNYKTFVMRTNNAGTPIWCYHYPSSVSDMAADMIPTNDGNFLILSTSNYNVNYEELLVIKMNPGGGVIWSKRIAAPAHEITGISIRETDNGDIIIGSTVSINLFLDVCVIKLNSSGNLAWKRVLSTTYDDELQKLIINSANEIFLAGYNYAMGSEWNGFIAKMDSSGQIAYDYFYDGGSYNGEKIRDMELAAGRIAFIGDIGTFDERNMFLASINTDGSIYFSKQYPYATNFTNYPYGLEIVNGNEYIFTGDVYTFIASREAGFIKTDTKGDAGCNTSDLQLNLMNQDFNQTTTDVVITDGGVIQSSIPYFTIVPDFYIKTLCEHIPPVAGFDTTTSSNTCPTHCYSFNDTSLYNPTLWEWYFEGANPPTSTLQNPTDICWKNSGTYEVKLIVTGSNGKDSCLFNLKVELNCPIHIPNVFSPNNDGTNDVFEIYGLPDEFDLVIYDRWGARVFESTESTNMWNGKIENKGANASDGVYYYVLVDYTHNKTYNSFLHVFN